MPEKLFCQRYDPDAGLVPSSKVAETISESQITIIKNGHLRISISNAADGLKSLHPPTREYVKALLTNALQDTSKVALIVKK